MSNQVTLAQIFTIIRCSTIRIINNVPGVIVAPFTFHVILGFGIPTTLQGILKARSPLIPSTVEEFVVILGASEKMKYV